MLAKRARNRNHNRSKLLTDRETQKRIENEIKVNSFFPKRLAYRHCLYAKTSANNVWKGLFGSHKVFGLLKTVWNSLWSTQVTHLFLANWIVENQYARSLIKLWMLPMLQVVNVFTLVTWPIWQRLVITWQAYTCKYTWIIVISAILWYVRIKVMFWIRSVCLLAEKVIFKRSVSKSISDIYSWNS